MLYTRFAIYYLIIFEKTFLYRSLVIPFLISLCTSIIKTKWCTRIICHSKFVTRHGKIAINSWRRDSPFLTRIRKMRFTLDLCSSFLITVSPKLLRKLARFPFRVPVMYCSSCGGTERRIVKPETREMPTIVVGHVCAKRCAIPTDEVRRGGINGTRPNSARYLFPLLRVLV